MSPEEPIVKPSQMVEPTDVQPEPAAQPDADEAAAELDEDPTPSQPPLTWQASEYLHHAKGVGWYLILIAILVVLCGAAAWFHQWLAIAVFVAAFAAVVVYGGKAPRTLSYRLDSKGLTIEDKSYPFDQFRSFGVVDDLAWQSIDLEPTKRFMPRLTILVESDIKDQIVERLLAELPRMDHQPDAVERATRYLRF